MAAASCPGDCAKPSDGIVDVFDLLVLLSQWGEEGGSCDLTGDGTVGVFDLLVLLSNWGPCPSGARSVIFDGGIAGDLEVTIERDTATVDPLGETVAKNEPRFGTAQFIFDSPGNWQDGLIFGGNIGNIGSGYDHDGTTPLHQTYRPGPRLHQIWRGEGFDNMVVSRVMTREDDGSQDFLAGTPQELPFIRYIPSRAAAVCHGAMYVLCVRHRDFNEDPKNRDWRVDGVGVIRVTLNARDEAEFRIVGDMVGFDETIGHNRLREWAMMNYFPGEDSLTVLDAWFPFVDYMHHSAPGGAASGMVGIFRAQRPSVDEPWDEGPVVTIYERYEPEAHNLHAHSAGVSVRPNGDLWVISIWGDGIRNSEYILHVCEAANVESYHDPDNWTHYRDFHGGSNVSGPDLIAAVGNQAVGTCPGPEFGTIIVSADEDGGLLWLLKMPDEPTGHPTHINLHGRRHGESGFNLSMAIHCPAPERG